jgi:2-succinyl-5-enolpyruvyl-6-hydroxy-3-cyclohexene-1-carboxylate synthase
MLAARRHPSPEAVADLAELVSSARRGALVCGPGSGELATAAARLAAAAGWPLLAEPTSGTRCGPHDRSHVIAHYDALLRCEDWAGAHRPELVVRLGDAPTSKPLRAWLARTRQLVVDPHAAWHEPTRIAESMIDAEPELLCSALADALGERADPEDWVASWRRADALVPPALEGAPDPFEPKAYAALAGAVPAHSILWVGSSMPIRDVETFFPQTDVPLRFLANRGANGIDGVTSSAVGAALAAGEARTFLLTGELSLLHDLGGLLAARRHGVGLTVICVNNGGGGIFDFLPIAEHADARLYEEHVATPSGVPIAEVAALAGLDHATATTPAEVRSAALRPGLVEVRTDRAANVRLHRALFEQIAADLR